MSPGEQRDCPYCQQKIPAGVSVCPACSRWVQPETPAAQASAADVAAGGDILKSLEETDNARTLRLTLAGIGFVVLCVCLAGGLWYFGSLPTRQAAELGTQEAINVVRTKTAQVVLTQSVRSTREAAAAEKFRATQGAESSQTALLHAKDWPVVLKDDFSVAANGWYTGTDEDELSKGIWTVEEGKYRINLEAKDSFSQWMWPTVEESLPENFYLAVRLDFVTGADRSDGGIIFRLQEDGSFYLFDLYMNGDYAIYRHYPGGWETILEDTNSSAYRQGLNNLLEVVGQGGHYVFFLNDINLGFFDDTTLEGGGVGVCMGLPEAGNIGQWDFDDFVLRFIKAP